MSLTLPIEELVKFCVQARFNAGDGAIAFSLSLSTDGGIAPPPPPTGLLVHFTTTVENGANVLSISTSFKKLERAQLCPLSTDNHTGPFPQRQQTQEPSPMDPSIMEMLSGMFPLLPQEYEVPRVDLSKDKDLESLLLGQTDTVFDGPALSLQAAEAPMLPTSSSGYFDDLDHDRVIFPDSSYDIGDASYGPEDIEMDATAQNTEERAAVACSYPSPPVTSVLSSPARLSCSLPCGSPASIPTPSSSSSSPSPSSDDSLASDSTPPTNTNGKPRVPCLHPHCNRWFKNNYTLSLHLKSHSAKRPRLYPCRVQGCNLVLSRQHDRMRHEISRHNEVPKFACMECRKSFSCERNMLKHKCTGASCAR